MSNHITDPVPGETIEVSKSIDDDHPLTSWATARLVGNAVSGDWVIETGKMFDLLSNWSHSRRPPKKTLKPWNYDSFLPTRDHDFASSQIPGAAWNKCTGGSFAGAWLNGTFFTWEAMLEKVVHRPSPSQPWQPCGVEVES